MIIINFAETPSLVGQYMTELRDVDAQHDMLRFRANLERIGQIMAYEISKTLAYATRRIDTPPVARRFPRARVAGGARHHLPRRRPLPRRFPELFRPCRERLCVGLPVQDDFEMCVEYLAAPSIEGKTLIIADPMLATGASMELSYRALLTHGTPAQIHVASVIASQQAVDYIASRFPADRTTMWIGAIDPEINSHSYIVPGLGDAGDLAYGPKL